MSMSPETRDLSRNAEDKEGGSLTAWIWALVILLLVAAPAWWWIRHSANDHADTGATPAAQPASDKPAK